MYIHAMKFKSYTKTNTKGNDDHWVGLMKRNSVFECPPVQERKLSDAPCDILRTSSIILVFLIFVFDIMEIKTEFKLLYCT